MKTVVFQMCGVTSSDFEFSVSRFEEFFDVEFNKGAITNPDDESLTRGPKRLFKKVRSEFLGSDFPCLSFALMPKGAVYYITDWQAFLSINRTLKIISGGIVGPFSQTQSLVQDFCSAYDFQYGYATAIDKRDCYPSLYLLGVNGGGKLVSSGPLHEKKQLIGKWRELFDSYEKGKIRSVYEMNFLGSTLIDSGLVDEIEKMKIGEIQNLNERIVTWEIQGDVDREQAIKNLEERIVAT